MPLRRERLRLYVGRCVYAMVLSSRTETTGHCGVSVDIVVTRLRRPSLCAPRVCARRVESGRAPRLVAVKVLPVGINHPSVLSLQKVGRGCIQLVLTSLNLFCPRFAHRVIIMIINELSL